MQELPAIKLNKRTLFGLPFAGFLHSVLRQNLLQRSDRHTNADHNNLLSMAWAVNAKQFK